MPSLADLFLQLQSKLSTDLAYNDRQHSYGDLLRSLVKGNFQFDEQDMSRIWKEGRLSIDEEGIYSMAVEHGNKSAARSMETKLKRPPYILFDQRIALGQTRWVQGRCARISNIDENQITGAHSSLIKMPWNKNHVAMGTSSMTKSEIKVQEKNLQEMVRNFPQIVAESIQDIHRKVEEEFGSKPWYDMLKNVGGQMAWTLQDPETKWLPSILQINRAQGSLYLQFEKFSIADMQHWNEIVHHATVTTLNNLRLFDSSDVGRDAASFKHFWTHEGNPVSLFSWRSIEARMLNEKHNTAEQKVQWFLDPCKHGISRNVLKSELDSAINVLWQGIALHNQKQLEHDFHMEDYRDHLALWSPNMRQELTRLFLATQNNLADGRTARKVSVKDPENIENHWEACFHFWFSHGNPWIEKFIQTWTRDEQQTQNLLSELKILHTSLGIDDPKILAHNHAKSLLKILQPEANTIRQNKELEFTEGDWAMG